SRADGLAWFRRMEAEPVRGSAHLRRRWGALLYAAEKHHATVAVQHQQGGGVHHAHAALNLFRATSLRKAGDCLLAFETLAPPLATAQVTPHKAGIGAGDEHRKCDRVELPSLGKAISHLGFKCEA